MLRQLAEFCRATGDRNNQRFERRTAASHSAQNFANYLGARMRCLAWGDDVVHDFKSIDVIKGGDKVEDVFSSFLASLAVKAHS
jgi:hypothetical protein